MVSEGRRADTSIPYCPPVAESEGSRDPAAGSLGASRGAPDAYLINWIVSEVEPRTIGSPGTIGPDEM
jgi:hypothetical protein